jgi:DNA-binding PadR family transcriptional regulator
LKLFDPVVPLGEPTHVGDDSEDRIGGPVDGGGERTRRFSHDHSLNALSGVFFTLFGVSRGATQLSRSKSQELSTTAYAVLGLLCLREWSAYELAQQMQRSMRVWWPRAESRAYAEPQRLKQLGLVRARDEGVGDRPRTVYTVTAKGRRVFETWLDERTGLFRLEFEAMLKVFFADQGSKAQLSSRIADIARATEHELDRAAAFDDEYLATGGPFPERLHLTVLATDLYLRFLEATLEWSEWAEERVADWETTTDGGSQVAALERRRARVRELRQRFS